jgi:hypothetical protein
MFGQSTRKERKTKYLFFDESTLAESNQPVSGRLHLSPLLQILFLMPDDNIINASVFPSPQLTRSVYLLKYRLQIRETNGIMNTGPKIAQLNYGYKNKTVHKQLINKGI